MQDADRSPNMQSAFLPELHRWISKLTARYLHDCPPGDLLITMVKETVILYKEEFRKTKKKPYLFLMRKDETRNDCEIACECVKRANVVLLVGLCEEIFARKHTATHKPTSAQTLSAPHSGQRDIHTSNKIASRSGISMNGVRVPACQKHKHLGVVINNSLSWSDHIDDVFTKCARHVGILNSLRKKLSKRCLTSIYKGYIRPRLEYACAVWSGGNTSKLLKLQQKFCRQHQVQLPNLSNRFKFHTLTLFYKIRNGLAPTYLSEILPETLALSSGRNLRRHVYPFPRINKSSTMQSFLPRATVFWNELPASIQSSSSLHSFKAKLRDLLKI